MADEADQRSVLVEIPEPQAKITGENNNIIMKITVSLQNSKKCDPHTVISDVTHR